MTLLPRETELLRLHDQFVSDDSDDNAIQLLEYIDSNYDTPDVTSPQYCNYAHIAAYLSSATPTTVANLLVQYPMVAPATVLKSALNIHGKHIKINEKVVKPYWKAISNKFSSYIL